LLSKSDHNGRDLDRWKFPLKDGKLGDVKFSNPTAREFTKNTKTFVDICLTNHPEIDRSEWFRAAELFETTMKQLCSLKKLSLNMFVPFKTLPMLSVIFTVVSREPKA